MAGVPAPVRVPPSDWSGVRELRSAPPVGEHPRVFFGADEIPEIRARLRGTAVGREAMAQMRAITTIVRKGRKALDQLPQEQRCFANGQPRVANAGLHCLPYEALAKGSSEALDGVQNPTCLAALAGSIALEAFLCLVDADLEDVSARSADVARAVAAWAGWKSEHREAGRLHYGLAYDMAHGSMSEDQRAATCRALVETMSLGKTGYYGAQNEPESVTSNWATLNTHHLLVACSVEGETAAHGLPSQDLDEWFEGAMRALAAFFTHGIYSSGAPYEGMGKNNIRAAHLIAFARRGHNFFGHPHVRAYATRWLPAIMQPFGHSFTLYDLWGGTGPDPVRGKKLPVANDFIGLKFMYPDDPAVDFLYLNGTHDTADGQGDADFIHISNARFPHREAFMNELLCLAIFASDATCARDEMSQRAALQGSLDYVDLEGGTLVARSSFLRSSCKLQLHARQDLGGHTFADRGSFCLSALGRIWFCRLTSGNQEQASAEFNGETLVDGRASMTGRNMKIPAKLAAWSPPGGAACFATCDSTYSYCFSWAWKTYPEGQSIQRIPPPFELETATYNTFRRSDNKSSSAHADTPFFRYPHWNDPFKLEGIQRKPHNPMQQVIRTAGLVRGEWPYALVLEDICKDGALHEYSWHVPIADDLELLAGSSLPAEADPWTDVVLREPPSTGDRALLVRVLSAGGEKPAAAEGPAHRDTIVSGGRVFPRLVVQRAGVVAPEFLVLFFPFQWGQALPVTRMEGDTLRVDIGAQRDVLAIHRRKLEMPGRTVSLREFMLERDGQVLLDYRGLIEPVEIPRGGTADEEGGSEGA